MILKREIKEYAEKQGVTNSTIDKDWVLGHFIDAIFSIPECRNNLVFKGGTCLRKCYFPDYRFSEDLDFTSISRDLKFNNKILSQIVHLINERIEIPLFIQELKPLVFNDQLTGYQAKIKFWGSDHPRNQVPPSYKRWTTSVKIEIILYEILHFENVERKIFHPYSDPLSNEDLTVPCYSLSEILAEKLRSLIQRSYTAPRDYYDIWYLSKNVDNIDWDLIDHVFHRKLEFKGFKFKGIDQIINKENDAILINAWRNSLRYQISEDELPTYGEVKLVIKRIVKNYLHV